MLRRFEEFREAHAPKYERITHAEAFTAQEEAAAAHISGWSWAKVVIVKHRDGFAMAVLPACCTIDMNRLGGAIGFGEIELASVEDMLKIFPGCELGAIPPFGRLFGVRTFVEDGLLEQRDITMPAGDHRTAVRMRTTEYLRLVEPQRARFAVHEGASFPVHRKPRGRAHEGGGKLAGC